VPLGCSLAAQRDLRQSSSFYQPAYFNSFCYSFDIEFQTLKSISGEICYIFQYYVICGAMYFCEICFERNIFSISVSHKPKVLLVNGGKDGKKTLHNIHHM
jgi:hypothetical protein